MGAGAYAAAVHEPPPALAHLLRAAEAAPDELTRLSAVIQVCRPPVARRLRSRCLQCHEALGSRLTAL